MQRVLASAIALWLTGVATAEAASSSGCYAVTGIARGDTLALSSGPSAQNRIVDRLVAVRHGVLSRTGPCIPRRVAPSSRWCPVTHFSGNGTTTGWAKARYLGSSGCP